MIRRYRHAVVAAVALVALAGCSAPLPEPDPEPEPAVPPPVATEAQVERVLTAVGETLAQADTEQDAAALEPRVTGPARDLRALEYRLVAAEDADAVTTVPQGAQTMVVPSTDTWPRTLMTVTAPPEDLQPPLLLTLVQESPREQYELWSWVRLFPGVQMPATNQPELGSEPVDPAGLLMSPDDVLLAYVGLVQDGAESEHAEAFDAEDPLRAGIVGLREQYEQSVEDLGSFAETYQPGEAGTRAVSTADGGAIVVGTMQTVTTLTLEDSTLPIGDGLDAFFDEGTVLEESLAITWTSVVAFAVPPAGSADPIRVLGAEHNRTDASGE